MSLHHNPQDRSTFTPRKYKNRDDYAAFRVNELRAMLERASDRLTRAESSKDWMIDAYAAEEISAAIVAKGVQL